MHKLEENIKRLVASKVLKDIDKIVESDSENQKQERYASVLVVILVLSALLIIAGLSFVFQK